MLKQRISLHSLAGRIHREGYSDVAIEPHAVLSSVPYDDGRVRMHSIWFPQSYVRVLGDDQELYRSQVINPKWGGRLVREYPPYSWIYTISCPWAASLELNVEHIVLHLTRRTIACRCCENLPHGTLE